MAKATILTFFMLISLLPYSSNQLQYSQYEALLKIEQQLNFPQQTTKWTENADFCNTEPTQMITLACYQDNLTQLYLTGNSDDYFSTQNISTISLFSNIATLTSLKVLSLVSLGLNGSLPSNIANLTSLEILNISSNSFQGSIPFEISSFRNLQTLILDHNNFSGEIPDWICYLPSLSVLSVKNNSFSGSLPNALSTMFNLRTLILSLNNLSAQVPALDNLTNLQVLDMGFNNFGPQFPILPSKLVSLVLKNNRFHSTISVEMSHLYQLQKVDISMNELVGPFYPSLLTLPSLTYLDISGNKFTGKLVNNMSCNEDLKFVNMSENRLTGDLPDCLKSKFKNVSYNGNCLSSRRYKDQNPVSFCHGEALAVRISPEKRGNNGHGRGVIASSMVGGIVGVISLVLLGFLVVKKRKLDMKNVNKVPHTKFIVDKVSPAYTLKLLKDARYISETMKLGSVGIPPYRTFGVDELKEATNNFNKSSLIGEGSNGQVYKGCLTDGTFVAIRSFRLKKRHTFTHQLELISKLRHPHLVSAIGHCYYQDASNSSTIYVVFEYVPNGNLRTFISGQKLRWKERICAGIGVAKGIQFLHTGIVPGIYSNHLKITDILMDRDFHVKISKYNLPLFTVNMRKRLDETEAVSKENFGSMEEKNDVYDFGVILLEMIVGRTINTVHDITISKDILSVSLTADGKSRRSIVDPTVHKECSDDSLKTLIELCIRCLSNEPCERPSVEDIIWNLQFAAQVHDSSINNQDSPLNAPSFH